MVILEDEADLLVAKGGQTRLVESERILPGQPHVARGGAIERADDVQKGALARSAGPDDHGVFARLEHNEQPRSTTSGSARVGNSRVRSVTISSGMGNRFNAKCKMINAN